MDGAGTLLGLLLSRRQVFDQQAHTDEVDILSATLLRCIRRARVGETGFVSFPPFVVSLEMQL
jgi:hypothetical protein